MPSIPCTVTDKECIIITTGVLGDAVGVIERHEIHGSREELKALMHWHFDRYRCAKLEFINDEVK